MPKYNSKKSVDTIAKLFIVLRESVCKAGHNDIMRKHLTIEQMEKYTNYIDAQYKG